MSGTIRGHLSLACVVLMMAVGAHGARAAAETPEEKTEPLRAGLFAEGKALADAGNYAAAAEKFRAVIKIRSAPKAWIALAFVEEKQQHLLAARDAYATATRDAAAAKLEGDRVEADAGVERLTKVIPHLLLSVPKDVTPTIEVDGKIPSNARDIEVDPGAHLVVARAPKRREFRQTVTVGSGDRREVVIDLPTIGDTSPVHNAAEHPANPNTRSGDRTLPAVVFFGGLALGGVGAWAVIDGFSRYNRAGCRDDRCPSDSTLGDAESARTKVQFGWAGLGIGAAAVIGGATWYMLSGPSSSRSAALTASPVAGGATFSFLASF